MAEPVASPRRKLRGRVGSLARAPARGPLLREGARAVVVPRRRLVSAARVPRHIWRQIAPKRPIRHGAIGQLGRAGLLR
eukprot:6874826-Prymnesium_polylepis.1